MNRLSWLTASSALILLAAPAGAFTEDVCYLPDAGGIADCTPLPAVCMPAGTDTPACRQAAIATFAASTARYDGGRSTIHVDTPYILAQAVGFAAEDAYWIGAYSEAVDLGTFTPRDETGAPVDAATRTTASLTGLERNDFTSGGVLLHFSAPLNTTATAVPGIDGLHPDFTDASREVMLAHLRSWALAGSGGARPDCAGGFTSASAAGDFATGAMCFPSGTITGSVTLFDGPRARMSTMDTQTFMLPTGLQVVQDSDAGTVTSDHFDTIVGGSATHIADARLAIYLHAYGDRTSHHVCLDASYTVGPADGGFDENMTNAQCAQGLHTLRHIWETGVDYAQLAAADRTTIAYLGNAYDELVAFATARGVLAAGAMDTARRAALIDALTAALATPGASARLAALHAITCARGLTPFPGEPACTTSDAGTPATDAAPPASDAATSDAATSDAATADGSPATAVDAAANAPPSAASTHAGCGCAVATHETRGFAALGAMALGAALRRRRSRRA